MRAKPQQWRWENNAAIVSKHTCVLEVELCKDGNAERCDELPDGFFPASANEGYASPVTKLLV